MAELVVALDVPGPDQALALADRIGAECSFYKVGLELFTSAGPTIVRELKDRGNRVFLDLKLHDIPTTVARAVDAAGSLGVDLLTVHTTGGPTMLRAAAAAGVRSGVRLLGVTLLTSLSRDEVAGIWGRSVPILEDEVVRLAHEAAACGLHGVVASPLEASAIRQRVGPGLLIVTPGIRLAGGESHDQTRVATPAGAVAAGADLLVVGRAVTADPDPAAAFRRVMDAVSPGPPVGGRP